MANKFKYNKTGSETNSIFKGNWAIDNTPANSGGGPSSATSFYHGAPIPNGGYTIYSPGSVYTATTDDELLGKVRDLGGDWSSASAALTWASTDPTIVILNKAFDNLVTDGLVLNLDASNISSFTDSEPTVNIVTNTPTMAGWQGTYTLLDSATKTFTIQTMQSNAANTSAWRSFYWSIPEYIGSYVTISAKVILLSESGATFSSITIGQGNTGTYTTHIAGSNAGDRVTVSVKPISEINMTWSGIINATGIIGFTQWIDNVTQNGGNAVLQVSNVQIEAKSTATPFVNGTRTQNSTLYDLSGNNKNGTLTNGPALNSNGYITFDGNDDYISILNPLNQLNTSQVWSVSALVKLNAGTSGPQYIISGLNNGVAADWYNSGPLLYLNGGANDYYTYGSGYIGGTGWNHLTYLFNNSTGLRQIYKNGILIGNGAGPNLTSTPAGQGPTWYLGQMAGSISALQIYNRVISTSEIYQNYYEGPIVTSGLVFAVDAGNLVSYEPGTTTAYNLAGSNNLTLSNGLQYNAGNSGYFLSDGSDDGLVTLDASNLDLSTFTLEGWVWWNQHKNFGSLLVKGPGGSGNIFNYAFFFYAGNIVCGFGDGGSFYNVSISAPTINAWHHIVGTYDGATLKFYLDGVLQAEAGIVATPYQNTSDLNVIQNAYPIDGRVATSRLYNRALTADEVVQNFRAQRNRFGI